MKRFFFLDAVTNLADDILEYAAMRRKAMLEDLELREAAGGRQKPGKSGNKSMIRWIVLAAAITVLIGAMIPVGIFFIGRTPGTTTEPPATTDNIDPPIPASDVHLTAISGQTLTAAPENLASAASISAGWNAEFTLLSNSNGNGNVNGNGNGGNGNHYGWVDVASHEISAIPQALVLFDDNRYASVGIELDNPYDYYIADFYMICDQPGAQIFVDDRWIPLDGSVKIRWTGATNRYTSYYVYIPDVSEGANITITDMRYLNETEIAVDIEEHNVANIYQIESPVRTEFLVNRKDGYYFRIVQSDSVTSLDVENAAPNSDLDPQYNDVYVLTKDGAAYTIRYTFTVPGTDVSGSGTITSPEITLLTYYTYQDWNPNPYDKFDVLLEDRAIGPWTGPCVHQIGFYGSGLTFHAPRANSIEKDLLGYMPSPYVCDQEFEVRLDGDDELLRGIYADWIPFAGAQGRIYLPTASKQYKTNNNEVSVEVYWNGYLIFSGVA